MAHTAVGAHGMAEASPPSTSANAFMATTTAATLVPLEETSLLSPVLTTMVVVVIILLAVFTWRCYLRSGSASISLGNVHYDAPVRRKRTMRSIMASRPLTVVEGSSHATKHGEMREGDSTTMNAMYVGEHFQDDGSENASNVSSRRASAVSEDEGNEISHAAHNFANPAARLRGNSIHGVGRSTNLRRSMLQGATTDSSNTDTDTVADNTDKAGRRLTVNLGSAHLEASSTDFNIDIFDALADCEIDLDALTIPEESNPNLGNGRSLQTTTGDEDEYLEVGPELGAGHAHREQDDVGRPGTAWGTGPDDEHDHDHDHSESESDTDNDDGVDQDLGVDGGAGTHVHPATDVPSTVGSATAPTAVQTATQPQTEDSSFDAMVRMLANTQAEATDHGNAQESGDGHAETLRSSLPGSDRAVTLDRAGGKKLGILLGDATSSTSGVQVLSVDPAEQAVGRVLENDTIITINGTSCIGMSKTEAAQLVGQSKAEAVLTLHRTAPATHRALRPVSTTSTSSTTSTTSMAKSTPVKLSPATGQSGVAYGEVQL